MIKAHCFEKGWIDGFRTKSKYKRINPPLLEKMIQAFSLLQHLKTQGLGFIFKGGTSLMLLLEQSNRFSVDIDIITEETRETIEKVLDEVVIASHFIKWELDEKRSYKAGVPKAHYQIEYNSALNRNSNYILLDILFEKSCYPQIQPRAIQTHWIDTEMLIEVNMPTIESITGDKLTAFAPTTTGILYGKGKGLEIVKQLFDLGTLFDEIQSIAITDSSFRAFAAQEIAYRELGLTPEVILQDIIDTCRVISQRERNRIEPEKTYFKELQDGIRAFDNYLIAGHFRIEEAIIASAKVAYLAAKLLKGDFRPIEKYDEQATDKSDIENSNWNYLNRIKRFPDKSAFFYWYKCLETLGALA
jgi:hypothetical protein